MLHFLSTLNVVSPLKDLFPSIVKLLLSLSLMQVYPVLEVFHCLNVNFFHLFQTLFVVIKIFFLGLLHLTDIARNLAQLRFQRIEQLLSYLFDKLQLILAGLHELLICFSSHQLNLRKERILDAHHLFRLLCLKILRFEILCPSKKFRVIV